MLEALKDTNLTVAKVSALKESLPELWNYLRVGWARRRPSFPQGWPLGRQSESKSFHQFSPASFAIAWRAFNPAVEMRLLKMLIFVLLYPYASALVA